MDDNETRPATERGMAEDEVERLTAILMPRNLPGCRNGPITEPRELAAHILAALRSGQER